MITIGAAAGVTALLLWSIVIEDRPSADPGVTACQQVAGASADYRVLSREFASSDYQTLREAGARWVLADARQGAAYGGSSVAVSRGEELLTAREALRLACADHDVDIRGI
jgi:hypothetical protein